MKQSDISLIFRNLKTILKLHEDTIDLLNSALSKWPFVQGIGQVRKSQ